MRRECLVSAKSAKYSLAVSSSLALDSFLRLQHPDHFQTKSGRTSRRPDRLHSPTSRYVYPLYLFPFFASRDASTARETSALPTLVNSSPPSPSQAVCPRHMLAESGAEPTKGCGACRQVLPRASYTDAQWANKKFRGEGRRCNACSSSNAMSCAAADTHATVVAAALRVGGPVGATFPDAWAVAWENVLRAVLKVDLGRLTAVLMRNLSACGTSKAEKVAHRALAEECWSLLCGRPIRAPSARPTPRSPT